MLETLAGISLSVRVWFCCDIFSYVFMVTAVKLTWSIKTNTFFPLTEFIYISEPDWKVHYPEHFWLVLLTSALEGFARMGVAGLPVAQMGSGDVVCLHACREGSWSAEWIVEEKNRSNYSGVWVKTPKVLKLGEKLAGHPDMSKTHWLVPSVGFGGGGWRGCWLLPAHLTSARACCSPRQAVMEQLTWLFLLLPQVTTSHIWFTEIVCNKCFIH